MLTFAPSAAYADVYNGDDTDNTYTGTSGDDAIDGGGGNDLLNGAGGDDVISGGEGNDELNGGPGDDTLDGGNGHDTLTGGRGDDTLTGGDGEDVMFGGPGDDTLNGGNDSDVLFGGRGDDTLNGGNGDDVLFGGRGADILNGGNGNDVLYGEGGDDILCGQAGDDLLIGGNGTDLACAVADRIGTVRGVTGTRNLATNDERLDDEAAETSPLQYALVGSLPAGIFATLDANTGVLTYTATRSGTLTYRVFRTLDNLLDTIESLATITITVAPVVDPKPASIEPAKPVAAATVVGVLPNTGASSDPRVLVTGGIAALIAGTILIGAGTRPRERHTA